MSEVVGVFSWMCGEGWLAVLTPATLSDLSFVSSHPGPLAPPTPLSPHRHQQKDLLGEEEEVEEVVGAPLL